MIKQKHAFYVLIIAILMIILLVGCSNGKSEAVSAIETYINALGNKDSNQIITVSCADWEESALVEVDSLAAVGTKIEDLACNETGQEGNDTLISCSGKIALDYGGEAQYIDLAGRTYVAHQEAGEWLMCGYR